MKISLNIAPKFHQYTKSKRFYFEDFIHYCTKVSLHTRSKGFYLEGFTHYHTKATKKVIPQKFIYTQNQVHIIGKELQNLRGSTSRISYTIAPRFYLENFNTKGPKRFYLTGSHTQRLKGKEVLP